jgi:hypothetical protein
VYHVNVTALVSRRLGELIPTREGLLRVLNRLYDQLENHADVYRNRRDPQDPDHFTYEHALYVNGRWRRFRFSVNDVRATGHLFVMAVSSL